MIKIVKGKQCLGFHAITKKSEVVALSFFNRFAFNLATQKDTLISKCIGILSLSTNGDIKIFNSPSYLLNTKSSLALQKISVSVYF